MRKEAQGQKGFTLLETALAMIILMVAGLGAAALFSYAVKYNGGANDRAIAVALAQQRLEDLRNRPFGDAALNATTTTGTVENNVSYGGRPFRVTTIITNDTSTIKTITLVVRPLGANGQWAGTPVTVRTRRASATMGQYL